MKVGIDIDDTLAQTTNYLIPFAIDFNKNVLNKNNEPDLTKDLLKCFGWNKEETLSFIHTIFEKHALNIPPIDNAKSILKKLREEGNNIIIITARNDSQLSDPYGLTEKWLEINGIEYDKLIVNAKYKGPVVEEEQIDLIIGMGGYISGIAMLCKLKTCKKIIHEQNKIMGFANKVSLKYADKILLTFDIDLKERGKYNE